VSHEGVQGRAAAMRSVPRLTVTRSLLGLLHSPREGRRCRRRMRGVPCTAVWGDPSSALRAPSPLCGGEKATHDPGTGVFPMTRRLQTPRTSA
jgi:hypothetical protein